MMNRLPEKLSLLRKCYGYSQGDVSGKLDIPLTEYLNWENGNSIPKIRQLKQLADLFHIELDVLADNSKTIVIPEINRNTDSIQIPFPKKSGDSTQELTAEMDDRLPLDRHIDQTRVMDTTQFQATTATTIIDDSPAKPVTQEKTVYESKNVKKRNSALILGFAAIAVAVILGAILLLRGGSGSGASNTLSDDNRLALGNTYSLYIDKNGRLITNGTFETADSFSRVIQVSAWDGHALGLKADGTVVSSLADDDVRDWTNITMVAAGRTHSVGVRNDGTVLCTGSQSACAVDGWNGIEKVYAGNAVTLGVTGDGAVRASGDEVAQLDGKTNVSTVAIGETGVILVHSDGTCETFAIGTGSPANVSSWSSVVSAVSTNVYSAGLTSDGKVLINSADEDMVKKVESWTNIAYIAGKGDTLIAFDKTGKMYGVGDNTYNRYVDNSQPEKKDDEEDAQQLETVSNIKFTETTANIQIKWNAVKNADYYALTVSPSLNASIPDTATNSASIPASQLTDGETYTVTIVAHANDEEKYEASEPASIQYTYKAKTIQLSAPSNVHAQSIPAGWYINWEAVDNADYYIINVDGMLEDKTSASSYTMDLTGYEWGDGSSHTVTLTAYSNGSTYTESEKAEVSLVYDVPKYGVTFNFKDNTNTQVGSAFNAVSQGVHTLREIVPQDQIPAGYALENPDLEVGISSDYAMDVSVILTDSSQGDDNG